MTTRDRLGLIGIGILALLAVGWFLVVSPERKKASEAATQVTTAQAALASAEGSVASATQARERYSSAYSSIVSLGKAVPPSDEVPSLIYQLARATNQKHVEFNSITTGSGSGASASAPAPAATAAAASAGLTQMPFTFIFNGSFDDLYHLFKTLNASTVKTSSGGLEVNGRLLTLQGVKLEHAAGTGPSSNLTGTITATAYVLPAGQSVAAGASPSAPASSAPTTASSASSGSASSTAAPVATIGAPR
jgi:Tfp pilus assembly protein PilO